jgi:ankyrin repeat protein
LLLAQGAKVNARNRDGKTPLSRVRPKPEIAKILRQHGGVE